MKICLINNLYHPFERGGAEQAVEAYRRGFEAAGHKVFLVTIRPSAPEIANGKNVHYLGGWHSGFFRLAAMPAVFRFLWLLLNFFDFSGAAAIKKILKREAPDLVISHNLLGINFLLPLLCRRMKIEHYHFLHDIQLLHPSGLLLWGRERKLDSFAAKIYQAFTRALFSSPTKVISPSDWLLREHLRRGFFGKSAATVLANPITAPEMPVPRHTKKERSRFRFLYVGQIEEQKGILFLAHTFISSAIPDLELFIVGSGSKIDELKKIIKGSDEIKILGRKSREEVMAQMTEADCLIVPSLCYENSPTVIHEAVSVGLPVIASRLGGIPEILKDDEKFLFEPGNKDDLLDKMRLIMSSAAAGSARTASIAVADKISSFEQIIQQLLTYDS